MATWDTVSSATIARDGRWDVEFYVNPYNDYLAQVFADWRDWVSLSEASVILTSGHTPLHHDVSEGDTIFITVECIDPLALNLEKSKRVWKHHATGELSRVCVKRGNVLITIKRRIALACPILGAPSLMAVNQDVAVMTPKPGLRPGFIAAVLNSRVGQFQALRYATEQMNPYINVKTLGRVLIPRVPDRVQAAIEGAVETRLRLLSRAADDYRHAEAELLDRFGWAELERQPRELAYSCKVSSLATAGRSDPEHFQPRYERIESQLSKIGCASLGALIEPVINGFDCRDWEETGTPYLRVGDVDACEINEHCQRVRLAAHEIEKNISLTAGDVLLTRKGTFGRAAEVKKRHEGWIISSEIMRLRLLPKTPVCPGYLALYICSPVGYSQVEKYVHGVSNFSISQPDVAKVLVFLPRTRTGAIDVPWQEKLAAKVEGATRARDEANAKLTEAKRLVEEALSQAGKSNGKPVRE